MTAIESNRDADRERQKQIWTDTKIESERGWPFFWFPHHWLRWQQMPGMQPSSMHCPSSPPAHIHVLPWHARKKEHEQLWWAHKKHRDTHSKIEAESVHYNCTIFLYLSEVRLLNVSLAECPLQLYHFLHLPQVRLLSVCIDGVNQNCIVCYVCCKP